MYPPPLSTSGPAGGYSPLCLPELWMDTLTAWWQPGTSRLREKLRLKGILSWADGYLSPGWCPTSQ
jgi:hypothetical protein